MINIMTTLLTQIANNAHDMHHTFDAVAGTILIITRLVTALGFLVAVAWTYTNSRYRVKQFLCKFGPMGFCYICALPFIVFVANSLIEAKDRN